MSVNIIQTNIFDLKDYQTKEEIARTKRKRGCYKKKQPKIVTLNPYTEMKNLYELLASYLPLPLFSREERVFTYKNIKAWYMVYDEDIEDVFIVSEAEIIGTENMNIEDRIRLHKKLTHLLSGGMPLDEALKKMEV